MPGQGRIVAGSSAAQVITLNEHSLAELERDDRDRALVSLIEQEAVRYRIGPGDQVKVTVWGHPELNAPSGGQSNVLGRQVRADGKMFFPYAGLIDAGGLHLEELRLEIARRLSSFIDQPQVDVNLLGYGSGSVSFSGAFKHTAPVSLTLRPLSLSEALGMAQPDPERADRSRLALHRRGEIHVLPMDRIQRTSDALNRIYLQPGDHIYLPYSERNEVQVLGEVATPRTIALGGGTLSINQALGRAGGLAQGSVRASDVYVLRPATEDRAAVIYRLDASSPAAYLLGARFELYGGDVVFAAAASVSRWNRFISQVLPWTGALRNAAAVKAESEN